VQDRQMFNAFDHREDSVSLRIVQIQKKINPELKECTGDLSCYGAYAQNHITECYKDHNAADVFSAKGTDSGGNLGYNMTLNPRWSNSAALPLH